MGVTDVVSGFLYNVGSKAGKLLEKQRKDIESTVKKDLKVIDAILRSVNSRLSSPGSSS